MAKSNKRKHLDVKDDDSDSDAEVRAVSGFWPRWLIVEGTDNDLPLSTLSPFAIEKGFSGLAGKLKTIKRLRDGSFLVECECKRHSDMLLKSELLVNRPIKVSAHKTLNSTKGVIKCRDLRGVSELEIKKELASQGVIDVRRATFRKGSERVPTDTLFLTFCRTELPSAIKVGYLNVKLSLFIPSPLRCFKCQKYGHVRDRCQENEVCGTCSKPVHEGECESRPLCANCGGDHPSSSRKCPSWLCEQEIQRVKVERKIPFFEAKKIVQSSQPTNKTSYAAVVRNKQMVSEACQTEITWIQGETPRIFGQKTGTTGEGAKTASTQAGQQSLHKIAGQHSKPLACKSALGGGTKPASFQASQSDRRPICLAVGQAAKPAPSPRPAGRGPSGPGGSAVKQSTKPTPAPRPAGLGSSGRRVQGTVEVVEVTSTPHTSPRKPARKKPPGPYQEIVRQKKMETDAIKVFNRFDCLSDDEMNEDCPEIDGGKAETSSTTHTK